MVWCGVVWCGAVSVLCCDFCLLWCGVSLCTPASVHGLARPRGQAALFVCPPRCLPAAIRNAVRQLQRQANILLLALALSNAAALEHGPLHVVATVEVAGAVPKPQMVKYWESRQLSVGGVGPAPQVPMRLRIRH